MSEAFIPVNEPRFEGNEAAYLAECIRSGWVSSEGPYVKQFESDFASRVERAHGIAVCNGTAALDVAVAALGIGPGDEVILPTFTIVSCAAAVVQAGATPVVVDADPDTWNMRADEVAQRITERTRAIMAVHIYGLPVDMDPLFEVARAHGLAVIEDAAEVIGQTYKGRPCGSFGNVSTFSFYPNKHITTGEGGMVVTNDEALAAQCRSLRNLCFGQGGKRFVHESIGWNYRLSNLQAAVGVAQLEQLDATIRRKREIGTRYHELLADVDTLQLPPARCAFAENIFWVFGVVLRNDCPLDAAGAMQALRAKGIGTRPFFYPMHRQPVFLEAGLFAGESHPVAERLAERGFYLPSGLSIEDAQVERVAAAVKEVLA